MNNEVKDILNQHYITANDLMKIIPEITYHRALEYIKEARDDMKEKGYFLPTSKKKVALTKIIKKKFGF